VDPQSWWFTMPPQMHLCSELWKISDTCSPVLTWHPLAGHSVTQRPFIKVCMQYYWSRLLPMSRTTASHVPLVPTPNLCHKPYGLLKQLMIPKKPWNSISWISWEAPSILWLHLHSSHCWSSLKAVTLHSNSWYHHITSTCTTLCSTWLSKHSVPSHTTSNCSMEFVSHFFQSLGTALDMKLHFTSGYHPEGDGQTEWNNQTLEQYLQVYCNYQQDNWSELLPFSEFCLKQYS